MTDKIDAIVDSAIAHTREQLESLRVEWAVARVGLERIHDALAQESAGHPALERLRDFIAGQARLRRDQ